jgi:hypothetical protein
MSNATPLRASQFIATLGINTHLPYTDGSYANVSAVLSNLEYLGIDQVRDTISNGANGSAPLSTYIYLAQQGIKFTFCISADSTTATLDAQLALIDQVNEAVPGSVTAVEGANEVNLYQVTFNGVGGLQGAINLQEAIYSAVTNDANLKGVAVDYFTGYNAGSDAVGPDPATTAGLATNDNQHPYPGFGQAPAAWVAPAQALGNETAPYGPAVYTETGYSTNGGTTGAVNNDVQANYLLDLLMDDAKNGIALTYIYQLLDAYAAGSPQGDDGFGLFAPNGTAKPSAVAIHNLTAILADAGATARTFTPIALGYTIASLPSDGNSMVIEKSSGAYDVVIWAEPQIWNEATGSEIAAPSVDVTVTLGGTYKTVNIFDPMQAATSVQTLSDVSTVTVGVTDHPIIIEVEPWTVTTTGTPPTVSGAPVINGQPGAYLTTTAGSATIVNLYAGTETVQSLGADTINAGSGYSVVYANTDASPVTINGAGADSIGFFVVNTGSVFLGAGSATVVTYTGGLALAAGAGSSELAMSGGNNTISGGVGQLVVFENGTTNNLYEFADGSAGGSVQIYDFNVTSDHIHLTGYSESPAAVVATANTSGGATTLTLADDSRIILYGVEKLSTSSFV